jgi:hypothetical protein
MVSRITLHGCSFEEATQDERWLRTLFRGCRNDQRVRQRRDANGLGAWHSACLWQRMSDLPDPVPMRRRWVGPVRLALVVTALAVFPVVAASGQLGDQAKLSVLHVLVSYGVLVLAFRLIGKRELSQMSPFELVTLMLIPEILSNTVQGEGTLLTSVSGLSAVLLLVLTTSALSQRFPSVQRLLESSPTLLVANGKLLEDNMNRERIAPDELFGEMHKHGVERLEQVRFAVLESDGTISVISVDGRGKPSRSAVVE